MLKKYTPLSWILLLLLISTRRETWYAYFITFCKLWIKFRFIIQTYVDSCFAYDTIYLTSFFFNYLCYSAELSLQYRKWGCQVVWPVAVYISVKPSFDFFCRHNCLATTYVLLPACILFFVGVLVWFFCMCLPNMCMSFG